MVEDCGTDNSSSGEEQHDFAKNFQAKVESKNPWDRVAALGKVTHILKAAYLEDPDRKVDLIDKKLIKGFYQRALNQYQYLEPKSIKHASDIGEEMNSDSEEDSF